MRFLTPLHSLVHLYLARSSLTDTQLCVVGALTNLQSLDVSETFFGQEAAAQVRTPLVCLSDSCSCLVLLWEKAYCVGTKTSASWSKLIHSKSCRSSTLNPNPNPPKPFFVL